jgi:hypothetical protein
MKRKIPKILHDDRALVALLTQWRNCHARYQVCCKRVNWKNPRARKIEKQRRKEKWVMVARIREIERTCLRFIAKAGKHPDLYSAVTNDGIQHSRLRSLTRDYVANRYACHHLTGDPRKAMVKERATIVAQIRTIEREWMVLLYKTLLPSEHVPSPLKMHPLELRPRKLKQASRQILKEVA